MAISKTIAALQEALRILPGVGPRNAQRMAFHLLERDQQGAQSIVDALQNALDNIHNCARCNTLCEHKLCEICDSAKRDATLLCVVETPTDLEVLEQTGIYNGMYFVLMGRLSPLEGIGPEQLAFDRLQKLLGETSINEVVIATNNTAEGETTAEYTQQLLEPLNIKASRLARGLPVGGELEYMDQRTLAAAFEERR